MIQPILVDEGPLLGLAALILPLYFALRNHKKPVLKAASAQRSVPKLLTYLQDVTCWPWQELLLKLCTYFSNNLVAFSKLLL